MRLLGFAVDRVSAIDQADNMFPETTSSGSKALSIFIAVLVLLLVVGGISWFYFNSQLKNPESVASTPTSDQSTPDLATATEPTITTAPADLATAISQLDNELSIISQDEQSDDNTIDL